MEIRQKELLSQIIQEYITSAKPVGSTLLVDKYCLNLSSATIRNEMAELEEQGLISQPHTSAGRIPTEKGFRYFIEHALSEKKLSSKESEELNRAWSSAGDCSHGLKQLSRALAEQADNAIVLALSEDQFYYTGLSNLFRKPEFSQPDVIIDLGEVMDHLDDVSLQVLRRLTDSVEIWLGSENPFGKSCGIVLTSARVMDRPVMLGILGPLRMDYAQAKSLIHYSQQLIQQQPYGRS